MNLSIEKKRQIIRVTTIIGIILTIVGSIYIGRSDYFKPGGGFHILLENLGWFAPVLFILVQISQIIYPIIPLGLTNVIGVLIFGHAWGFVFNCTGMLIGSAINFQLGRRFGESFVKAFVSDDDYDKYIGKMNEGDSFKKLLRIGFFAPVFPDDVFCMISGMSSMTFKEFYRLVVIYRPISLFIFTFFSAEAISYIFKLIFG